MINPTRRSFLAQTPIAAASLSLVPIAPVVASVGRPPGSARSALSTESTEPIVIHVNDIATGAMTLFVGAREIVLRNPRIIACLKEAVG